MAEFKSTIYSQDFDKALQGGLDYAADKSGIQEALKELSAKGFVYIGPEQPTDGTMYWLDTSVDEPDVPVEPDEPDEPDVPVDPEVTLTSISATYSGGDVAVGTALTDLTGIVVTAAYSDGSTATVTGYTLSGTIAEGSNTITVTYEGKTATFTVTGVAEEEPSGGVDLSEANVYSSKTITSGNGSTDVYRNDSTHTYDDFMALAAKKLYFYFEPSSQYRKTIQLAAYYNSGYGTEILAKDITVAQATSGTYDFLTNAWDKYSESGYMVYEIDVAALQAKIQEMYETGTLDSSKSKILSVSTMQQALAGSTAYLLYNYNG